MLARALSSGVSIGLPVFSASAPPSGIPAAVRSVDSEVALVPQVVPTPFEVFRDALDRKAKGAPLPSDEVWLSGAESRGVAMPDGTIMAAGEVVLPPLEPFSLRDVACAQRKEKYAAEARAKSAAAANPAPIHSKWGPPLALVGSKVEVEWDKGWCQAD